MENARSPDDDIEVIVQFRDDMTKADRDELRRLDFTVFYEFNVIPAVVSHESFETLARPL